MLKVERKDKLYEIFASNISLTSKNLISQGFNYNDINCLINEKVIERCERGVYDFVSGFELYTYYRKYRKAKEIDKAYVLIKKAHEKAPENESIVKSLFELAVSYKDEKVCLDAATKLISFCNYNKIGIHYFYLYLLSNITEVPQKYEPILNNLSVEDISFSKIGFPALDKVCYEIIQNKKINKALKIISKDPIKESDVVLINHLLYWIKKINYNKILQMNAMIKCEDYKSALDFFNKQKPIFKMSYTVNKKLLDVLINFQETKSFPLVKEGEVQSFNDAIFHSDFKKALEYEAENEITHDILIKINIEKEYLNLINYLQIGDFESFKTSLKLFLKYTHYEYLETVVWSLLKISVRKKNLNFTEVWQVIKNIKNGTYKLDINYYYELLSKALDEKAMQDAEEYFQIVQNLPTLKLKKTLE